MSRQAKAVVARTLGGPVTVETVQVQSPKRDEVMLRMHACGVCHSDLSALNGTIPFKLPLVLGHEGAGVVV
jgi:S-(hydroxymethyl)glutathione dehydrogenase/alcohol dehydrogenase